MAGPRIWQCDEWQFGSAKFGGATDMAVPRIVVQLGTKLQSWFLRRLNPNHDLVFYSVCIIEQVWGGPAFRSLSFW